MHIIEKKPNVNKNGLKLIFVRIKEMFQQYLFSLSNHQAYNIQYRFITLGTTTTKLDCLYIVFFKIPTPYRNLTAPFLCFQLQFVSIAPSPRLVYSDNSSPRYTWYHARGCRRKWRSCLSCQLYPTCQSTCLSQRELQIFRILNWRPAGILWQNQKRDFSYCDLSGCTCKTRRCSYLSR